MENRSSLIVNKYKCRRKPLQVYYHEVLLVDILFINYKLILFSQTATVETIKYTPNDCLSTWWADGLYLTDLRECRVIWQRFEYSVFQKWCSSPFPLLIRAFQCSPHQHTVHTFYQHFFGHGKNACDGIGGSTKRLFRLASLRGEALTTTEQLYIWAQQHIPSVTFILILKEAIERNYNILQPRMKKAKTIKGTRQLFQFIPGSVPGILMATELSNQSLPSQKCIVVPSSFVQVDILTIRIGDFLVVSSEGDWWITRVEDHIDTDNLLSVTFFNPKGSECETGKGLSEIRPIKEEAVSSEEVIFNLRSSAVRFQLYYSQNWYPGLYFGVIKSYNNALRYA